ncbi:hypothetical protein [Francisella adeliensis]|uniref:Uncharacterized protein n=2 Tax=Francisella adeliensis TaxID=2007306 RepID=A0A2Z4XZU3_9GAMM|nr:hypothetical protein [Francisella adeliensis]AXA34229.1 hypothetical protein CDH04_07355 [Francisella adeliensis]MBK2084870.1 hypothetical protein [Francisella adeliensis]QIW12473.1 hypothetical protein FZC43_07360 [Francisella adeliensis]QIW14346.1 hypothetical protein FZC44_07355 [Francisella adeliensis]
MGMKKGQVEFQSINIFDATVIYPYPTWFKSGLIGNAKNDQKGPVFSTTQIPTGQTFKDWNEKYTINAIYGKYQKNLDLNKFMSYSIAKLMNQCKKEDMEGKALLNKKNDLMMVIYCGKYSNNSKKGEIGIFRYTKYKETYFDISQRWKVDSFNVKSISSVPLKKLGITQANFKKATEEIMKASFSESLRPVN